MIRYALLCANGHAFDAWFAGSDAYARQRKAGQVACAICGTAEVDKALMAPALSAGRKAAPAADAPAAAAPEPAQAGEAAMPVAAHTGKREELIAALRRLRRHVTETADYVGPRFPEEARKIHYGETEKRGIYGEASPAEARELAEEGIDFHPLPVLPEDRN